MICKECGQEIRKQRSTEISDHFHSHVTQVARELALDREYVYQRALLLACEIEADGGSPYPYTIVNDVLYPCRTTGRTNREMMTAIEAVHFLAAELGIFLNEKEITQ